MRNTQSAAVVAAAPGGAEAAPARQTADGRAPRTPARGKYPRRLAAAAFAEWWMLAPFLAATAAALLARLSLHAGPWVFLAPALVTLVLVAARYPRNLRQLKARSRAIEDRARRAERHRALVKPGRDAADALSREKHAIVEKSSLSGLQLGSITSRLDQYEGDFVDLLYTFQVRAATLRTIRARDFGTERRALEADRERLAGAPNKGTTAHGRALAALDSQETLLARQEAAGADIETSLDLIRLQAKNIQSLFTLVYIQVSSMPLGADCSEIDSEELGALADAIETTKRDLESLPQLQLAARG